jgi:hypothetical protein
MKKKSSFETAPKTMCITQATLYLNYWTNKDWGVTIPYELQRHEENQGKHYDIYTLTNPSTKEKEDFYFDITPFYGRGGLIMNSAFRDLPPHGQPFGLSDILGEEDANLILSMAKRIDDKMGADKLFNYISSLTITFKQYSSNMMSQYIAFHDWQENTILVTPIRMYQGDIPILHSFNLYRLFIIHQIDHVLFSFDRSRTETPIRGNYYEPILGQDCIGFKPLPDFNFANDFLNYTFWSHTPTAFFDDYEINAFRTSAIFGQNEGLFSVDELIEGIRQSVIEETIRNALVSALEK